jgi:glycosyltransferase involved in cell wall biosynthesis
MTADPQPKTDVPGRDRLARREAIPANANQPSRLRVLFINDTSRNGGPGRSLFYILKFLDPEVIYRVALIPRSGIVSDLLRDGGVVEETIFEPRLIENLFEPWSRAIRREDFDAPLGIKAVRAGGNVIRAAIGMVSLIRRVKTQRFDLVFCNGTTASFAGGAIAAFTGVPALWYVCYTSVPSVVRRLHARLAAGPNVRSIVCVSQPTAGLFAHCPQKTRIIPDAIDVAEFDRQRIAPVLRQELGFDEHAVIFGSHGRVLPKKGYVEMVRAARVALDRLSEEERRRCRFVVLGDTPQDMRRDHLAECRALVRELNLADVFYFLGHRPEVKPYVCDFDVAVVPSIYNDPLPRAVMEAMALSLPVVAFDQGGIGEMIEDGISGALVGGMPPDISGLANSIVRYLRDAELRHRHGRAARRRIEDRFEAKQTARALQDEMLRISRRELH